MSEIYYDRGTFLQRQQIEWLIWPSDDSEEETFFCCPHQSLNISKPIFSEGRSGVLEVQCTITNNPQRFPRHRNDQWNNLQGQYVQIMACNICHSDAECIMEMSHYLQVTYTCYRDLRSGTYMDDKWISLLTGEDSPERPADGLALYTRVFRVAQQLRRKGLES
jgi:hypothetical protein